MKRALLLLSLPLLAASCGSVSQPGVPQPGKAALVPLKLSTAGNFKAQGLAGVLPTLHFDVRVRDNRGQLIAFNGTTYDPTGTGTQVLSLNGTNGFQQTLLLPAGDYTFENAVLDDDTSSVLLAYGPAQENPGTVRGDGSVVRLKFHAVFDKASSMLIPTMNLPLLFTDSTFNLALKPQTAAVGGLNAAVPTADLGDVTYGLGNPTDGVLNNVGSKVGINVTARGTAADSILNVTASFNAWVRDGDADTASYRPVTLEYAQSIETNSLTADTVTPTVTFEPVNGAAQGNMTTLSGTATDDVQLQAIRVYADGALVASTEVDDGVTAIATDADGKWSAGWTPSTVGSQELVVVATDSSGNESRAEQTVTVSDAPAVTGEFILNGATRSVEFDLQNGVSRTFKMVVPVNFSGSFMAFFNPGPCVQSGGNCQPGGPTMFTATLVDAQGQPVSLQDYNYPYNNDENGSGTATFPSIYNAPAGEYWVTITPMADTRVSLYGFTY